MGWSRDRRVGAGTAGAGAGTGAAEDEVAIDSLCNVIQHHILSVF